MTDKKKSKFVVLGAGSWGTALAILLAKNGHQVSLWTRKDEFAHALATSRTNDRYLPGIDLPESIRISSDLTALLTQACEILVVVPSSGFRSILETIKPIIPQNSRLVWATKGLEQGSNKLMHEVVNEVLPELHASAVISGPTFAMEVARGLPTALTVASNSQEYAKFLAVCLHNETFRAYISADVVGVQLGGAIKNVLAIATGIADGLGFGANTRAALVTRGLAEMIPLGQVLECQRGTFMGLAGLGDLVLTCTDDQSRNRRLGLAIGSGKTLEQALAGIDQVVEGVQTTREVFELAQSYGVEMAIVEQVYRVLYENCPPKDAVHALLEREQKPEIS